MLKKALVVMILLAVFASLASAQSIVLREHISRFVQINIAAGEHEDEVNFGRRLTNIEAEANMQYTNNNSIDDDGNTEVIRGWITGDDFMLYKSENQIRGGNTVIEPVDISGSTYYPLHLLKIRHEGIMKIVDFSFVGQE